MISLDAGFLPNTGPRQSCYALSHPQLKRRRSESTSAFGRVGASVDANNDVEMVEENRPRKTRRLRDRVPCRSTTLGPTIAAIIPTFRAIDLSVPDALGLDATTPAAFSRALEDVLTNSPIEQPLVNTCASTSYGNEHDFSFNHKKNDWWFPDGDIIIGVDSLLFKVHKKILASHSSVFADMFALSRASDKLEDVDSVQLHDSAEEWLEALDWIYNKRPLYTKGGDADSIPFTTIQRHLAISNKYDMVELQEQALVGFENIYPNHLGVFLLNTPPSHRLAAYQNATDALLLARRCNVPSVLPTIFYCLATSRYGEDGHPPYHPDMDPYDLQRLKMAKEILSQANEALTIDFTLPRELMPREALENIPDAANDDTRPFCQPSGPSRCKASLLQVWWNTSSNTNLLARGDYLLPERLKEMIESSSNLDLCPICRSALVSRAEMYLRLLLCSIPGWFGVL